MENLTLTYHTSTMGAISSIDRVYGFGFVMVTKDLIDSASKGDMMLTMTPL